MSHMRFISFVQGLIPALSLLVFGCGDRTEPIAQATEVVTATPESARPSQLSESDRELMFGEILRLYRRWYLAPGKCGTPNPWLSQEYGTHHTEGRHFALVYPDSAERLALGVLGDPEAPAPDRTYAWFILGVLAPRTSPELERFLVEKCADTAIDDDFDESYAALSCLADRRFDERCLALCRLQARRGSYAAYHLLSQVIDAETITLLKELTTWSEDHHYPIGAIPGYAEDALKKIALLQAKDWEAQLQTALLNWRDESGVRDTYWAIAAAKRRGMASLKSTLEKRLNEARARGEPIRPSVSYPEDFNIDLILVTYAKAGGDLNPAERQYLGNYGILDGSEERLLKIMAERSRSWRR